MDLIPVIEKLRKKRSLFHSEADFQFALAWEIKCFYPTSEIRLEYAPENEPNKYIDILVYYKGYTYPIELKYKTKKLSIVAEGEQFNLKNHRAQDLGNYDFVKDICRIESFSKHLNFFKAGYILWLTNDQHYWNAPVNPNAGYTDFSVHHGVNKSGTMFWKDHLSKGTIRGREKELVLHGVYEILWHNYSEFDIRNGLFKYALTKVY